MAHYKVIANYPNSPYKVGYIIKEEDNLEGATFFKTEVHKYPHIFNRINDAKPSHQIRQHHPTSR